MTGSNTYSGPVNVNGGTLQFNGSNPTAVQTLNGAVWVGNNAGGTLLMSGSDTLNLGGQISGFGGYVTMTGPGTLNVTGNFTSDNYLTLSGPGAMNVSGSITNNGGNHPSVTVNGPGTLTLSGSNGGSNGFTGGVIVNGGVLSVASVNDGAGSNLGSVNNQLFLNGGTLQYTGTGADATGRGVRLNGNPTVNIANSAANVTLAGQVYCYNNGQFTLTKVGPGTLTIAGTNTSNNSGLIANVTQGTLAVGQANSNNYALYEVSNVSPGATLQLADAGNCINNGVQNMNGTFDFNALASNPGNVAGTGAILNSNLDRRGHFDGREQQQQLHPDHWPFDHRRRGRHGPERRPGHDDPDRNGQHLQRRHDDHNWERQRRPSGRRQRDQPRLAPRERHHRKQRHPAVRHARGNDRHFLREHQRRRRRRIAPDRRRDRHPDRQQHLHRRDRPVQWRHAGSQNAGAPAPVHR